LGISSPWRATCDHNLALRRHIPPARAQPCGDNCPYEPSPYIRRLDIHRSTIFCEEQYYLCIPDIYEVPPPFYFALVALGGILDISNDPQAQMIYPFA
jgi:hypothetical protein